MLILSLPRLNGIKHRFNRMQGAVIVLIIQTDNYTYLELNSTYLGFIFTQVKLNLTSSYLIS